MKTAGIIAEYNPFHNGHLYQVTQTKQNLNCDYIVAVMSGNFSQRGELTISDKFTRTKAALKSGVDIVLELPIPFATSSAEMFSSYAINLLNASSIIDFISFGSECGNLDLLNTIATCSLEYKTKLDEYLKEFLREGQSYPSARMHATTKLIYTLYPNMSDNHLLSALKSPNNILGIEYIKALKCSNSSIMPYTLQRVGAGYHDASLSHTISSATGIRENIYSSCTDYQSYIPDSTYELLTSSTVPDMERLVSFLHFKLMFSNIEDLYAVWDIPKELIHTLIKHCKCAPSYKELVNLCTSKTYTKSTVQRSLLRLLLNIKTSDISEIIEQNSPPYIRVLGCKKSALGLLSKMSKTASSPIITNLGRQYSHLTLPAKRLIDYELYATKLYSYALNQPTKAFEDFTHPFIIEDSL